MLIEEDHLMHDIAAEVPYDIIAVLVDSPRYGGGSIALDYCVSTVDHPVSPRSSSTSSATPSPTSPTSTMPVRGLLQRFLSQGRRAPRAEHHRPPRSGPREMGRPALAGDRRPDGVRQGPDRGPPGRPPRQPRRPGQGPRCREKRSASDKEIKAIEAKFKAAGEALNAKIAAVRAEYARPRGQGRRLRRSGLRIQGALPAHDLSAS